MLSCQSESVISGRRYLENSHMFQKSYGNFCSICIGDPVFFIYYCTGYHTFLFFLLVNVNTKYACRFLNKFVFLRLVDFKLKTCTASDTEKQNQMPGKNAILKGRQDCQCLIIRNKKTRSVKASFCMYNYTLYNNCIITLGDNISCVSHA